MALAGVGFDVSTLVNTLVAGQNAPVVNPAFPNFPEDGWGSASGYATNVLDTLLALDALHAAGQAANHTVTQPAVNYLRAAQQSNGGLLYFCSTVGCPCRLQHSPIYYCQL